MGDDNKQRLPINGSHSSWRKMDSVGRACEIIFGPLVTLALNALLMMNSLTPERYF